MAAIIALLISIFSATVPVQPAHQNEAKAGKLACIGGDTGQHVCNLIRR